MKGDDTNAMTDIRWMYAAVAHARLAKPPEGTGSAFAERVAIKLDGKTAYELVETARGEAFAEMFGRKL